MMAFWNSVVFICLCVCSTQATNSSSLSETIFASPMVNISNMSTVLVNATPSLTGVESSVVEHLPIVSTVVMPSMSMVWESCRVLPSTCVCDQPPTVSVMSSLVNMTSFEAMVNMTVTTSVNISGSVTSYLVPANSSIYPNSTVNQSSMSVVNQSSLPVTQTTSSNRTMAMFSCTCYGQRTACWQPITPTSSMSATTSQQNTNKNGNNNGGNGNGNGNGNGGGSEVITSHSAFLPSATANETVQPSTAVETNVVDEVTTSMSVTLDTSVIMPSSTMIAASSSIAPTLPTVCITDCAGVPCGTAFINGCRVCVNGTTGRNVNYGKDCNNVCNGTARLDNCSSCTNPPENDRTGKDSPNADCHGTCFGSAAIDSCGNCSGGSTGKQTDFWKDACGVCGGDNSSCAGCDGVPNSGKVNDSCNVCGGDGSTCTTISSVVPSLLPTGVTFEVLVHGAGLDGEAIKCVLDGVETSGVTVDRTRCKCTIPSDVTAGTKSFTVNITKSGVDFPTANLQVELYNSTTTLVSSLSPSELLTGGPTNVVFEGSEITDCLTAVCMIDNFTMPAVFNLGSYTCSVPPFAKSKTITIELSLNGIHKLISEVSLTRVVFAPAPSITKAQFSDTGAVINVEFDRDVNRSSLVSCGDIFDSVGLVIFGTSPSCSWSDGRHLTISPGSGATVLPGGSLSLKTNVVKSDGEMHSKTSSATMAIAAPSNPVTPVAVIVGPTQISSCGHLSLDGSQSSGGGGRDLDYTWSLVGQTNAQITAVLDAARNNPKVFINGTLMQAGQSYKLRLVIRNFLSSSGEANIVVTKATDPLPEVMVHGPLGGTAFPADSFEITAVAKAASCSTDKALTYSWSVVCTNDDGTNAATTRAESAVGFRDTMTKSAVKIDAGSLFGGKTYEFTVVVALKSSPTTKTTVQSNVSMEWSPLEPAIAGGDRTIGRDSGSLILDAKSSTIDPDNADGDLSCAWICTDKSSGQPCYSAVNRQERIALPDQCIITIQSTEFQVDTAYKITSQVSKGSRTGSSFITLTVIAGNPPAVSVLTPNMKVISGEEVTLKGKYTSSVSVAAVEWVCLQETDYRYIDLSDASLISSSSDDDNPAGESLSVRKLKSNVLTPGASYKFSLNVNDGSKVGSAVMVVVVRNVPTCQSFNVAPTTLEVLNTVTLKAELCDSDTDALPLEYKFGFVDAAGIFQPWKTQTSNEYSIAVPPGDGSNQLNLKICAIDAFGSEECSIQNITVTPATSVNEEQVKSLIDDKVQEAENTGDYSQVVPNLANILDVVSSGNASTNLTTMVTNSTAETLMAAVKTTSLDAEKAEPILQAYIKLNTSFVEQKKEILDSFEKVVEASTPNMDPTTIKKCLDWVDHLMSESNVNDPDVVEDMTSIHATLASKLASSVDLGKAPVEMSSDDQKVTFRVEHSLLQGDHPTKTMNSTATVNFGSELPGQYGLWACDSGKYCMGVKLLVVNYQEDKYTSVSSTKPGILPDKVVNIILQNPETGNTLPVSGLSNPIEISFDIGVISAGKTCVVYYYSESLRSWSSDGITTTVVGTTCKASTNHLTAFAPAIEDMPTTQPTQGGAVTTSGSLDNIFQLSFVLSNTSWNDSYLNSSHPHHMVLHNVILRELTKVYENDTTLKNIQVDKFEQSGGFVKVTVKMTFDGSNDNPQATLQENLADGKLGSIAVDEDSVEWINPYATSESDDSDDTELIVGTVFGVFFGLAIILLVAAWLKNRQSRRKIGSSHPSIQEESEQPRETAETPA